MPKKIRQLLTDLQAAGWVLDHTKGSHRKYLHPLLADSVIVSGHAAHDAHRYQEQQVKAAVSRALAARQAAEAQPKPPPPPKPKK